MTEVERLNRQHNPPGYEDCGSWLPSSDDLAREEFWRAHEEKNDPPGMWSGQVGENFGFGLLGEDQGIEGDEEHIADARAAAWAHYWRADALAKRLNTGPLVPLTCECSKPPEAWNGRGASVCRHVGEYLRILSTDFWPVLRVAHGSQLDAVERWLVDGGEVPELLAEGPT